MSDLLRTYIQAWPGVWALDTARYAVVAIAMAAIVAGSGGSGWRGGSCRRAAPASPTSGASPLVGKADGDQAPTVR
ncbi:hypothetical protein [Reyranella sp.]|uniref:hypothetical protein n=1 Tax=Reyranella sp. TaxID=1929291 RepID=UPI00378331C6